MIAIYIITPAAFQIVPLTAPRKSAAEVRVMLAPLITTLTQLNITYVSNITSDATYFDYYKNYLGPLPYGSYATTQLLGGRLVPRSVVEKNNDGLTSMMRSIVENSTFYIAATALGVKSNPSGTRPIAANAVLPAWRDAILTVFLPFAVGLHTAEVGRGIAGEPAHQLAHPAAHGRISYIGLALTRS